MDYSGKVHQWNSYNGDNHGNFKFIPNILSLLG